MNAASTLKIHAPDVANESEITAETVEQVEVSAEDGNATSPDLQAETTPPSNDVGEEVAEASEAEDPIITTHVVALVDLEIDATGNFWEKGYEGITATAVGFVNKGQVYEIADSRDETQKEIEVVPPDQLNEEWEWDGLQFLYSGEWEYAKQSQVGDAGERDDSHAAEESTLVAALAGDIPSAPSAPSPMSPEEALREFQNYVANVDRVNRRLIEAQQAVYLQESVVKGEKDELKRRQERVEAITSELSQVCAAAPDPKRYPLFDKNGASDLPMANVTSATPVVSDSDSPPDESQEEPECEPAAINDSWKATQIEQLGLPQGINDKFHDFSNSSFPKGIQTMGDYHAFLEAGFQLTDIKGIGEAKVSKIEDAWEAWWGKQNAATEEGGES